MFAPTAQFGFRKNYTPGHYNMRFKPSSGLDGVYVATNAPYHGPEGSEPVSTCILPISCLIGVIDENRERPLQVQLRD